MAEFSVILIPKDLVMVVIKTIMGYGCNCYILFQRPTYNLLSCKILVKLDKEEGDKKITNNSKHNNDFSVKVLPSFLVNVSNNYQILS